MDTPEIENLNLDVSIGEKSQNDGVKQELGNKQNDDFDEFNLSNLLASQLQ